jgi:putative ABC transport system permease protein
MIDTMVQDIRYALRLLRLSPGFAVVAIVTLALGTGANTAIFQLLDAIRLRTLPVKAPQELVELRIDDMTDARGNWLRDAALTNPLWEQIRKRQQPFSGVFAWADEAWDISQTGEFRAVAGLWVSGDFFPALGIQPVLGRLFTPSDDRRGCGLNPGAVISYGFWQREFGGDPSVVGRKIAIGKDRIAVIGVTPPGFFGMEVGRTFDAALPICSEPFFHGNNGVLDSGTTWWLTVMGRLKPGVSMQQAAALFQANSAGIFEATLPADYPPASVKPYLAMKLLTIPAGHGVSRLREQYSRPLTLLLAIAALVLLIACVNLANLMLARTRARQREIAIRLALGASRSRLARQLVTEGLLLAVAGAGLGLLLARALSRFLVSFLATGNDPTLVELPQDLRIFGFAAVLAILTCLIFASTPVMSAARTEPGEALKSGSRTVTAGRERLGLNRLLIASQIAVSLVLLMGTLLFARSLRNLNTLDPGFQEHGVLVADLGFSRLELPPGRALSFRLELLQSLRAIPGVEAAAEATIVPLTGGNWNNRVWMDGSDLSHGRVSLRTMIGPEYFRTLRTPLLGGRDFDEHDLTSASKVSIVNEEFARRIVGGLNAVGKRFWIEPTPYEPQTALEIVGVVKNTKYRDLREDFQPVFFIPLSQAALARPSGRFFIRSSASSESLVASVRNALVGISPNMRYSFHLYDAWVQDSLLRERLMATLSGLFGVLALVLTAVGLYGVISYTLARRTNEIGIRMALGADRRAVVVLILREAAAVLAAGLGAGIVLTLAVGRAAATLLFGLEPYDPLTFIVAGTMLAVVVAAASYLPAWRASSVNPAIALRQD